MRSSHSICIAILGRPNVGKSTLFNRLTRTRQAIVADEPGVTRDRLYGEGKLGVELGSSPYIVIDTGGIGSDDNALQITGGDDIIKQTEYQARQAAEEADCLLFLVDAHAGLMPDDEAMAHYLRCLKKTVYLVVNKIDGLPENTACADFYAMGLGEPYPISSAHGHGITSLITHILQNTPALEEEFLPPEIENSIRVAFIGRPNVGKSTLINRILNEERVLVADMPGTTRDSIFIPFEKQDQHYTLIDTAGVRRRGKITEAVEKFSVIKTLQAIEKTQICVFLVDATEGLTDQDLHLIRFIIDAGKALVIGVNKWDGLSGVDKNKIREDLKWRLEFASFASLHFLSALRGTGVNALFKSIRQAYESATKTLSTPLLTRILESAVESHEPPMINGRRIKLRYAHPGGHNPPLIVIHGNQTTRLTDSYRRYLINTFRQALGLTGTPIRLELRNSENPHAGKKNLLTPRQERKRKRLMTFYKKNKK